MVAKKKVTKKTTAKTARPTQGKSRAEARPKRKRSIASHRDMLSTENLDSNFTYRWVLGATENDKRIVFSLRDGWEMVDATAEPDIVVGDYAVGKSDKLGSVYRLPAARRGREEYLYLMRMPKDLAQDYYDEAQAEVDETERALTEDREAHDNENGQYGGVKVSHELRRRLSK